MLGTAGGGSRLRISATFHLVIAYNNPIYTSKDYLAISTDKYL